MSQTTDRDEKKFIFDTSLEKVSKLIQQRQLSPVEVVEGCLKRIEELNPRLNAFITVVADQARKQARLLDAEIKAGQWRGALHGIPVAIKDFYDTAGIKTTAASEQFRDRIPKNDAIGVTKLKEAGAVILGKTNMHQLGMGTTGLESYFDSVKNPWKSACIPGGSSSGSAVAVASGMCYATLDTYAIGSCRLPAACCGVVGFKGTYGLISSQGILEGEEPPEEFIVWMNHPGIMTRNVKDTGTVLEVLANRNEHNTKSNFVRELDNKRDLRIGVGENFHADAEVRQVFEKAMESMRGFQDQIRNVPIPFVNLEKGLENIEADRRAIVDQAFKDVDVFVLPTMTTVVPKIKDVGSNPQGLSPENTMFANYYGLPAITVPCGFDQDGLPLGLQIVGKPWEEVSVLSLAYQFQEATLSHQQHPNP